MRHWPYSNTVCTTTYKGFDRQKVWCQQTSSAQFDIIYKRWVIGVSTGQIRQQWLKNERVVTLKVIFRKQQYTLLKYAQNQAYNQASGKSHTLK
jgi:hypothetical protein